MTEDRASDFERVKRLNAAARAAAVSDSIAQFENLSTHAQYRVPYAITSRSLKPGDRVLDWGCGNGHFSLFMEWLGARVTGYSFEPPPRCMAGSPTFQFVAGSPADPRSLPFSDASFDAVVGVGVLEHVWETGGDERASLAELARVVKPGGTLLTFHLPNDTGWVEVVGRALQLNKYFHKRRFNETEINRLWEEAGFAVVDSGLYNALPRNELRTLPGFMRHSSAFAKAYDFVDDTAAWVLPRVCTNFFVVAARMATSL
jgi:SAM-dependent methyltransferase